MAGAPQHMVPVGNSLERFAVEGKLGGGGMGDVYRALDRGRNARVALKVLRRVAPDHLYLFKREFRSLAGMSHPNLVTLYELIASEGKWIITMELVDGVDFASYVRYGADAFDRRPPLQAASSLDFESTPDRNDDDSHHDDPSHTLLTARLAQSPRPARRRHKTHPPLTTPEQHTRLDSCVRQLIDGVLALHADGHLHCDLKPSNVLVTRDGRAMLLDFGVVQQLVRHHEQDDERFIIGTPAYMAPEQAAGEPLSPPADWYAMGVMIHEAVAGRRPFEGSGTEVVEAKQHAAPPSTDGLPAPWAEVCAGLLTRQPGDRLTGPQAAEIMDRAGGGDTASSVRIPVVSRPPNRDVDAIETDLIGRERHLETLQQAFDEARSNRLRAVLVRGTSGMGKTALCRRFLDRVEAEANALVLAGRCYEQESVPYKAVDSVIDSLAGHLVTLPSGEVATLIPGTVQALARLFPVLQRVEAIVTASRDVLNVSDPLALRQQAFTALRRLLTRLAERHRVVMYIDDLQWADTDSAALLAEVLRPPDPPAMMILGTMRSEHAPSSPFLDSLRNHLAKRTHGGTPDLDITRVDIAELAPADATALAATLLERSGVSPGPLLRGLAANIARESGGSPYFARELVHYVTHETDGTARSLGGDVTLSDVLHARVDTLPEPTRRLLEVVCVAGQPISQRVAAQAAEVAEGVHDAIVSLRNFRLLRTLGARESDDIEPYHDRTRESIAGELPVQIARARHQRLAIALEATGEADAETLAAHYEAAGDAIRAGDYCERAAAQAANALAFERAASLYQRVLALRPRAPEADVKVHIRLADTLAGAGRGREAADAYVQAAQHADPATRRACRTRAAYLLLSTGVIERGLAQMRELLLGVGASWPKAPRDVLVSLLWNRARIWARGVRWKETPLAEIPDIELARLDMYMIAGETLGTVDTIRGAEFQARAVLAALKVGEPIRVARALALEAVYAAVAPGRQRETSTRTLLAEASDIAERTGDRGLAAYLEFSRATAGYLRGQFAEPAAQCARAEQMVLELRDRPIWELNNIRVIRLAALKNMGAVREYRALFEDYLHDAIRRGDLYLETSLRRFSLVVWLAADQSDEARRQLATTRWSPPVGAVHLQDCYRAIGACEIAAYTQTPSDVVDELRPALRAMSRSLLSKVQITRSYLLSSIARLSLAQARTGRERSRAIADASRAARKLVKEGRDFTTVWGSLFQAAIATLEQRPDRAVSLLRKALPLAEANHMAMELAAARRALGEHVGGDEGANLIALADEWVFAEGIVDPVRMAELVAPGLLPSA